MRNFFYLVVLMAFPLAAAAGLPNGSRSDLPEQVESFGPYQKLLGFSKSFPQQKVYIHTDKSEYIAGEAIWLKAYLVSAKTHQPDTVSTNLYVELVNTRDEIVDFLILRLKGGSSSGSIQLPDSLAGGNYQIKGYTNWMINFEKPFLFLKDIYIHNPAELNFVSRTEIRRNNRFNEMLSQKQERMQFGIFPEGGHLTAGLENRVAFKAANALGQGQHASGSLLDSRGNEILNFNTVHDGMGLFSFTPSPGESYSVQVLFDNGQRISEVIPAAITQVYLFRVEPAADTVRWRVEANFDPALLNLSSEIVVLAHTRGQVVYMEKAKLVDGAFSSSIPAGLFPAGITHFTLFGPNEVPVAERLVFLNLFREEDDVPVLAYEKRLEDSLVVVDFLFGPDGNFSPVNSSFSLGVTENWKDPAAGGSNIASYLLLTSDFGNTISDPGYYIIDNSPHTQQALDLLMLTHGWRRFVWKDLLAGKVPEVLYRDGLGLTIAGQVTPVSSARRTGQLNVEMSVGTTENRRIMTTTTDNEGHFAFGGINYEGNFTALISIEHDLRGRIYQVELFGRRRETTGFTPNLNSLMHHATQRGDNWQRRDRPSLLSRILGSSNGSTVNTRSTGMFGTPDQVVYMEDIGRSSYHSVYDILRDRISGLHIVGGEITLRGPSSIQLSNEPLFFVDEVEVNRFGFLNTPVPEIERIAVFRGPSTAILGSRGANGALLIYTRRAIHQQQYSYEFELRGYHVKRDFFVSKIQFSKYEETQVPRTLLWIPELTPDTNGRLRVRIPYPGDPDKLVFRLEGINNKGQITFVSF